MPERAFAARPWSLPWRLLVAPAACWRELASLHDWPWPALVAHWLLTTLGWLLTAQLMTELGLSSGLIADRAYYRGASLFAIVILLLPLIAAGLASLAGLLLVTMRLAGQRIAFRQALALAAYALLPFALGGLMSRIVFLFAQPLAQSAAQALALQLRPFTAGAATLTPWFFPPLSLQWFAASYLDAFGLWSVYVLWLGLRNYLGLRGTQLVGGVLATVLLLLLLLIGLWLAVQKLAAP